MKRVIFWNYWYCKKNMSLWKWYMIYKLYNQDGNNQNLIMRLWDWEIQENKTNNSVDNQILCRDNNTIHPLQNLCQNIHSFSPFSKKGTLSMNQIFWRNCLKYKKCIFNSIWILFFHSLNILLIFVRLYFHSWLKIRFSFDRESDERKLWW